VCAGVSLESGQDAATEPRFRRMLWAGAPAEGER
jgi:hypothetical protein